MAGASVQVLSGCSRSAPAWSQSCEPKLPCSPIDLRTKLSTCGEAATKTSNQRSTPPRREWLTWRMRGFMPRIMPPVPVPRLRSEVADDVENEMDRPRRPVEYLDPAAAIEGEADDGVVGQGRPAGHEVDRAREGLGLVGREQGQEP